MRGVEGRLSVRLPSSMLPLLLLLLLLCVSCCTAQTQAPGHCDVEKTLIRHTTCTSCAASYTSSCPATFTKTTTGMGVADCRYAVYRNDIGVELPGCRHTCSRIILKTHCCPDHWGPLCLRCPSSLGKVCNFHGTCLDGELGNGTCVCEEGFSGISCEKCHNLNTYGPSCNKQCDCVNGVCNSGPEGNGECYCQPPYSGPRCDQVSAGCKNCSSYSYCKTVGDAAVCDCLPGHRKTSKNTCPSVCSQGDCDVNAECSASGSKVKCACKQGYRGDGKICAPINPCSTDNGGCALDSTVCVFKGPDKFSCQCMVGMSPVDSSSVRLGCHVISACSSNPCHPTATCHSGLDGQPRCECEKDEVGDGMRCYGNLLRRLLELHKDGGPLQGKLSGAVRNAIAEEGCELRLTQLGPFTAFIPVSGVNDTEAAGVFPLCQNHLMVGQHLYEQLEGQDFNLDGGRITARDKGNKQFILLQAPSRLYTVLQANIPASNGIIHVIDRPITISEPLPGSPLDEQFADKTIGEILTLDEKYNRFLSLVDNCGAPLPLRGPGPLTVLVPTNQAIDRARDGSIIYMLNHAQHKLQEMLKYHMFSHAALTADQLASLPQIQTMANQIIRITVADDGRILLGEINATLESSNIVASNGIIHMVGGLLVPSSIKPILPHRCDAIQSKITVGPCVRCSYLYQTQCPEGSIELDSHLTGCTYVTSPLDPSLSKGCAKYCNVTTEVAECCKGFYGPDCKPCIGGFQHPCYDKGTCIDGIHGNGSCSCQPAFKGMACHICSNPSKYGAQCDQDCGCVHGECDNRPHSGGVCRRGSCKEGFQGSFCDQTPAACNSDGLYQHCHLEAYCVTEGIHTECVCKAGYEGDGNSCTLVNPCLRSDRGGCDINAQCVFAGAVNVSCVCSEGWSGDGSVCVEIDNCQLASRGGCSPNADCTYIGPAQSECVCKTGFMGDGIICEFIDPCLTQNGGCHVLATCASQENGVHSHTCTCPEGYHGDGVLCYGTILQELDNGDDTSAFYQMMKLSNFNGQVDISGNVTALVPSSNANSTISASLYSFWEQRHRMPHFVKAHFLQGVYSVEQLERLVGSSVPTLSPPTRWTVSNDTGVLKIGNVSIIRSNLPAINGYLHIIDQFLFPPISDLPPDPHSLMEFLNSTSNFSLFRDHALLFNLSEELDTHSNTILLPTDDAVRDYLGKTNSTRLTLEEFEYHIIPEEMLFPDHVTDGLLKSTLLGSNYQVQFHLNQHNQTMVNDVPLDGGFVQTMDPPAALMVLNQVLRIRKNHCSKPVSLQINGDCTDCEGLPRCVFSFLKPVRSTFPAKMKPNCEYKKRVGTKRKLVDGCRVKCVYITDDMSCCSGYYGHECYKCPGDQDSPCSNHGRCQDGHLGNGECRCFEGFHGSACEGCEPGRYGTNCTAKCVCGQGKCDDGLTGSGRCVCYKGWKGVNCTIEIKDDACGGVCDENANCVTGQIATCVCVAGYQGNGTHCEEVDLCSISNGGCSQVAVCTKVSAGERTCSCKEGYTGDGVDCQEMDGCLVNNGGCNPRVAACIRTGPNTTACSCLPGFSGRGTFCFPINLCSIENGGCGKFARCVNVQQGQVNCTCSPRLISDGKDCRTSTRMEISGRPENAVFRHMLTRAVETFSGVGPFTTFIPVDRDRDNFTTVEKWKASGQLSHLLWSHVISCETLRLDDLKTTPHAVSVSGHTLNFTVTQGSVYVNGVKVVRADVPTTDGVIHYVQSLLTPFRLQDKPPVLPKRNFTEAAEMYGYRKFSKMVQDAGMLPLVHMKLHQPLTMFWPTDRALNSMSAQRVQYLFHPQHRHLLANTVKAHIVRNVELSNLSRMRGPKTMHGSVISHSCDKTLPGNMLLNDNSATVVERMMVFAGGVAYGIDQLLEPPDLGARCDGLKNRTFLGRCGSCTLTPLCNSRSTYTGSIQPCRYSPMRPFYFSSRRWSYGLSTDDFFHTGSGFGPRKGCNRECQTTDWMSQCCKNHFGPHCQVCPGGLEAPCGDHGDCVDGMTGTGICTCHRGFRGTACELCQAGHYGANCTACNCTSGGWCDDGVDGSGRCVCRTDWTGERCDVKLDELPEECKQCHADAVCVPGGVGCQCKEQYEGNGTYCSPMPPPDLCAEYNGGCHDNADCNQTGLVVNCTCQTGYQGDGVSCQPINRCIEEENGGCSDFATCTFTGPNERQCECLPGYVGNGVQCLEMVVPPVDRCLEGNGGCDPKANCKDLHHHGNKAGVFLLRSPLGKYKMNFSEAEQSCRAEEASLATFKQLGDAQQLGLHICSAGWLDGGQAGYPTRFPSAKCGAGHIGVVLYKEPVDQSSEYDAYCYRMTDVSCVCPQGYVGDGGFCNGDLSSVLATTPTFSVFYKLLLDYSASSEAGRELVNFLSMNNSAVTLFVPHNDGFILNQTLTERDLEYHFSANQSRVQYQGLTHEAVISSRLGFNLTIHMNESCKLVNQRSFVDWDIPATNGIIHVIQAPLTAPPLPISPHASRGPAHSSSVAWVVVLMMIVLLVAGLSYYVYKHKRHAFRFHYFINEEENAASRQTDAPALVTFPNPLYRGQTAFNEPFEDSTQGAAAAVNPETTEAEKVVDLE